MNLRCFYCQTPFTLGRAEILAALQHMHAENMNHYDAHCPRCRRANSVARQRMEVFLPNWREELAKQEETAPAATQAQPVVAPAPATPAKAELAPAVPQKHGRKRAGSSKKTVAKQVTKAKKPAAAKAKPVAAKKTTAKGKKK
jgi:hypothetical protein